MSFAFGFTGDDFSDSEVTQTVTIPKVADSYNHEKLLVSPKLHSLLELLSTLRNVRLTFDNFTTPGGNIVYRRELFDIKHQAMMEEDAEKLNEVHKILVGSSNTCDDVDLRKNVYEGGFKLWECSYDLVDQIGKVFASGELAQFSSFLELGCGTSLPSCFLLMLYFQSQEILGVKKSLILSDFNYEVLRLVTVPNLIVHWASTLLPQDLQNLIGPNVIMSNDEVLLTPALLEEFEKQLREKSIEIAFISGLWGPEFCNIASTFSPEVILTSESIYSLESLPIVIDVLLKLLSCKSKYLALIAAKSYYFGVGGSINEFIEKLMAAKPETMIVDTMGNNKGQLKRDIVRLRMQSSYID